MGVIQILNLIHENLVETLKEVLNESEELFSCIGKLLRTVKNKLKDNCFLLVAATRKMSLDLYNKVEEEMNNMDESGIKSKFEKPFELVRTSLHVYFLS